jgi:succinate dehydrogenase/fumarate reductase flavoprotein subunit
MPSLSEKTEIGLPIKNLLGLLGITATAVWAYFGIIERLNNIETRATLFEADLVKNADQTPIDQEQFMLLEFVSEQVEGMSEDLENMAHNKVNIMRLQTDVEKALDDIEELKDKVRANGYGN